MTGKKTRNPLRKGHFTLWKENFSTYAFITHKKQLLLAYNEYRHLKYEVSEIFSMI